MKIAQIVCRFKPYKAGIGNVAYDNALGLAKLGHDVTVFTPCYSKKDKDWQSDNFKIKRIKPWFKFGNAGFIPQLFWQLKDFDIIHLHYPFFGGAEVIWILRKIFKNKKQKLVITYHHDVVGGLLLKSFFRFHSKFIMPRITKCADKVIITSADYARHSNIKKIFKYYPEKFTEIPLGVDLQRFQPQEKDANLLTQYQIYPYSDRVLVFVGALDNAHYFKGIDFLINSFNILDYSGCNENCGYQIKLIIVGDGDLKEKYAKQVQEMGLENKIKFAGRVADNDLVKYYNLADVVVLPSIDKSEAFGIVLVEAMACAKPVVAADLPGVRSVFENGKSGFSFAVKQEGDLANRINSLFMDEKLRQKTGNQARSLCEEKYNLEKLSRKLEQVFLELLK